MPLMSAASIKSSFAEKFQRRYLPLHGPNGKARVRQARSLENAPIERSG
jgi:hypothetical protein